MLVTVSLPALPRWEKKQRAASTTTSTTHPTAIPTVVLEVTEAVVEEEEDWLFAPAEAATVGDSVGGTHAEGGCVEGRRVGTAEGEADDRGLAGGALEG